jgi:hypothetical protein
LAIEIDGDDNARQILVNPSNRTRIKADTLGFFVAQSAEEVKG